MINITLDDKPISLTVLQALDLQEQLTRQLRDVFISYEQKVLNIPDALALASTLGKHVPVTTLRTAIEAGSIPGSYKHAGKLLMPEHAFLKWLNTYRPKS